MDFQVLVADNGRQRTTHGVWLGVAQRAPRNEVGSLLVMDVEGTDGSFRQDELSFERKTSLFSLAVCSVLIVNVWYQDVGRYNASNMSLLKTVFEIDLQLFAKKVSETSTKTCILFVVRDFITTPLDVMRDLLFKQTSAAWAAIQKPKGFEDSQFTDFFEFDFAALPHLLLDPDGFTREVDVLRQRFLDPDTAAGNGWLLKPEHRRGIPADGFCTFAETIWDVIKQNKDLDLPSQKVMLATYRCEEFAGEAYKGFVEDLAPLAKQLEKTQLVVDSFGEKVAAIRDKWLKKYFQLGFYYMSDVSRQKATELAERMHNEALRLFRMQLALASQGAVALVERILASALAVIKRSSKECAERAAPKSARSSGSGGFGGVFGMFGGHPSSAGDDAAEQGDQDANDEENDEEIAAASEGFVQCGNQLCRAITTGFDNFERTAKSSIPPDPDASLFGGLPVGEAKSVDGDTSSDDVTSSQQPSSQALGVNGGTSKWTYDIEKVKLLETLEKRVQIARKEAVDTVIEGIKEEQKEYLNRRLGHILEEALDEMWEQVRAVIERGKRTAHAKLDGRLRAFNIPKEDLEKIGKEITVSILTNMRKMTQEKVAHLPYLMETRFLSIFSTDANGLPKRWKPNENITEPYLRARFRAEDLLDLYSYMRLDPADDCIHFFSEPTSDRPLQRDLLSQPLAYDDEDPPKIRPQRILASHNVLQGFLDQFRTMAQNAYMQALQDQEQISAHTQIPMSYYVLLVLLGFNEFKAILSNPLLLILFLTIGSFAYFVYKLKLGGVVLSMLSGFSKVSFSTIKEKIYEYVEEQVESKRTQQRVQNELTGAQTSSAATASLDISGPTLTSQLPDYIDQSPTNPGLSSPPLKNRGSAGLRGDDAFYDIDGDLMSSSSSRNRRKY